MREKSFLYLAIILENWDITSLRKYESAIKDSIKHGISDAAVNARSQARRCFAAFAPIFPEQASHMLKHFDHRTQKTLRALLKPGDLLLLSSKGKSTKHSKIRRPQRTIQTSNNSSNASSANASPKTSPTAEGQYESTDAHQNSTQRPRSATLYEHISPKFHGIEMGQDDLARRVCIYMFLESQKNLRGNQIQLLDVLSIFILVGYCFCDNKCKVRSH